MGLEVTYVMNKERKLQALQRACRDKEGLFFRTFIVAEDGRVDFVEDNNQISQNWELKNLRPGLWRTFVGFSGNLESVGLSAVWICDGNSSREILDQTVERQEVEEKMRKEIQMRSQFNYVTSLNWEAIDYGPAGENGVAIRSRHIFSPEFFSFVHGTEIIEEEESTINWRKQVNEWYNTEQAYAECSFDDESGVLLGGAFTLTRGLASRFASAKDDIGQIIAILVGHLTEEEWREESDQGCLQEYDLVEHGEALAEELPQNLKPITLERIHGGDPHLETETPNYLPRMEFILQVDALLADMAAVVTNQIVEQLRVSINPFVDLSHVLDGKCDCQGVNKSRVHLINFNVDPSFWANLRKESAPTKASVFYHVPLMHHAVERGILPKPEKGQMSDIDNLERCTITEWTAPVNSPEWLSSTRPTLCPPNEYRLEPVFRYVGCGYALTPTSYPPKKLDTFGVGIQPFLNSQQITRLLSILTEQFTK